MRAAPEQRYAASSASSASGGYRGTCEAGGAITLQDRYTILPQLLGEGSSAKVYRGLDVKTGRHVAVKVYRDTAGMSMASFKTSIEVRSTLGRPVRTRNPSVLDKMNFKGWFVELLGFSNDAQTGAAGVDPDSGWLYIVFELGGENLEDRLAACARERRGLALQELRALHWTLVSVVCGLQRHGLVHLDIKPTNIVRFPTGSGLWRWKLIDLDGVSKGGVLVRFGDVTFTPPYMSPELASVYVKAGPGRAKDCGLVLAPSMDVWSAGMCALEAALLAQVYNSRYLEWRQSTGSDVKFLEWLGNPSNPPVLSGKLRENVSAMDPDMCDLLEGMLTADPAKRFSATQCLRHRWFTPLLAPAGARPADPTSGHPAAKAPAAVAWAPTPCQRQVPLQIQNNKNNNTTTTTNNNNSNNNNSNSNSSSIQTAVVGAPIEPVEAVGRELLQPKVAATRVC
ncbi:unnamed protein product, partial [Polarella glacialis]